MHEQEIDKTKVVQTLNRILEVELASVVRYTHYSFMIFGYNRIPIVSWMRKQASDSLQHAYQAGEMITALGEHPSLAIGPMLETHNHDISAILTESMTVEHEALNLYRELLNLTKDKSIVLEEYARKMIFQEQEHAAEVDKMLRKPGETRAFVK
jgi:bacterioferritin